MHNNIQKKKKKDSKSNCHFWRAGSKHRVSREKARHARHTAPLEGWANHLSHPLPNNLLKTLLSDCEALRGTQWTSLKCCFAGWTVHWVAIFYFSEVFFFFKILHHFASLFSKFSPFNTWWLSNWKMGEIFLEKDDVFLFDNKLGNKRGGVWWNTITFRSGQKKI